MRFISFLILVFFSTYLFPQATQTIRGTVLDVASNVPLSFSSVTVLNTNPFIGTVTDDLGNFTIPNVPVGRYDLQITHVGYEPAIMREITVISGKQSFISVNLKENSKFLDEVVVKPSVNKEKALNAMATLSAKMLSVEEAKRYAGGFDDPARLATSIAGVAGNTGDNGIIVRGNAPKFLQWKMEGIEIPNPNHFGDLNSLGGGTLTALSSQMLANSDFFTGAFPAEYNNALSGVFDIAMRTGNNQKREHTFQAGILGIDASSEGPFKKGGSSSYLFNYRYATLALLAPLLPEGAGGIKYQDLSFKLNFPTPKAGVFSLWGMGMIDGATSKAKLDKTLWVYTDDNEYHAIKMYMGAVGLSHKYFLNNSSYLKTTLAATANSTGWSIQKLNQALDLQAKSKIDNTNFDFVLTSFVNNKLSANHTNKTGILLRGMKYDLLLNNALALGSPPQEIVKASGFSSVISGYSSSSIQLSNKLQMNVGINSQLFTLNNHYTIEPRLGFRQQLQKNHAIGLAYGLHSRLEKLNYYFNNSISTGEKAVNKNLDFSKAHHIVLSYDWSISDLVHFKVETYYQQLFSIPVIKDSSFSFINLQNDLFFGDKLQSTGVGKNYGLDITLEKYISNGYYYLLTASLFNSKFKGGDGVWHNTRYNRNYVFNFLIGKEWQVGNRKQNTISLNTRLGYQGGDRYSPVNEILTNMSKEIVYDETNAFNLQSQPSLNVHFTANYKINKAKSSREIALKILNLTGQPDFKGYQYNQIKNTIDKNLASVVIPNLSYKIEF